MRAPRLRSPLARAVVPVVGGIAFFAVFFAGLWLVALVINDRADKGTRIGSAVFKVGPVKTLATSVTDDGPLLFPDLKSPDGIRSIVLDHTGDDPARGWQVYYGYPADRGPECLVEHIRTTRNFTDCAGRTVAVEALAPPGDVRPIVENRETLYIDLRGLDKNG